MELEYRQNRLLMQFFLASEALFFSALIIAFLYYRNYSDSWINSTQFLDATKTGFYTLVLLFSSASIGWAGKAVLRQNQKQIILGLAITILLGIVFLTGQGIEYARLIQSEMTISQNIFGSAFFTLTGFHGLHVLIGIVFLSIVLILSSKGHLQVPISSAFSAAELYWHFVDGVWIIVFFVVYIIPLL